MVKKILTFIFVAIVTISFAQVGINTNTPDTSSILDINASNKGVLVPRVALTGNIDKTTIANPATGLLVFNTNNGTNNTPLITTDDVQANSFYYWDGTKWSPMVSNKDFTQNLNQAAVPRLEAMINFSPQPAGKTTSPFLSNDLNAANANIRQIMYDQKTYDPNNSFNITNSTFTAPRDGLYTFEVTLLIRSYNNSTLDNFVQIGVSRPFTNFNLPPNLPNGTNDGTANFMNATFATLSRTKSTATSSGIISGFPTTLSIKSAQKLTTGQKVVFLTRFITPTTNTSSAANNEYSLDVESLTYSRALTSNAVITYYPQ